MTSKWFIRKFLKGLNASVFILLFTLLLPFCSKEESNHETRPDSKDSRSDHQSLVFLITLDTTRADVIDYRPGNSLTPNLAELASKGISFKNAFSLIPITLPSHFSIFYSMPPWKAGVYNNGDRKNLLYKGLTEILRRKGYYAGAVVSLGVLKSDFGLKKGFHTYDERFPEGLWYRTADEVNRALFKMLDKLQRNRSFFWVHYSDPHDPYFTPLYRGDFLISHKGKEIYRTDCTKSLTVEAKIVLDPGDNRINLLTRIPSRFTEEMRKNISGVGLRGFECLTEGVSENVADSVEIRFADNWIERRVKERRDYVTSDLNSWIRIRNKRDRPQTIRIRFVYGLRMFNHFKKKLYLEEIAYMDKKIGELIDYVKKSGRYNDTRWIIVGDHGEGFGEYKGHIGHIHYLNPVFNRVPLILSGKGIRRTAERPEVVSTLDIAPTVLDLLRIKKPGYMFGRSLMAAGKKQTLFLETYRPQAYLNSFSIINYPFQLIYFPEKSGAEQYEFYNLDMDPGGTRTIETGENRLVRQKMMKRLRQMSKMCLKKKQ